MKNVYYVGSGELTFDLIERIINENLKLELAPEAKERIQKCRDYLDKKTAESAEPLYGITTGFGSLCSKSISPDVPGATVNAFSSPDSMAIASASGVYDDSIESAALGPTPDTPISKSKLRFSLLVAKPKSSKASSLTLSEIYNFDLSPTLSLDCVVRLVLTRYPTPLQSMTAMPWPSSATFPSKW